MNFYSWLRRCSVWAWAAAFLLMPVTAGATSSVWLEKKSEHFIVGYQHIPVGFVDEVVRAAEDNYSRTMTALGFTRYQGWTWDNRVRITVYDSHEAYVGASQHGWSAGQVNAEARLILTYPSETGFFDATLPHELGHIILREAAGFGRNLPLWFDEGVAMYLEQARRIGADDDVKELLREGRFIPVATLGSMTLRRDTDRATVQAFYDEAASLVGFLIEEYDVYRFTRLCRWLKEGQPFDAALKKAYMQFDDMEALEKSWKEYLNETGR